MESLLSSLGQYGALGVITGFVLWQSYQLQVKILKVITDNTMALTKLSTLIEALSKK